MNFFQDGGVWKVQLNYQYGVEGYYQITGIVHSYPYPGPGYNATVSNDDYNTAGTYPGLNHYVIHSQGKIQYNESGVTATWPRSCW